MTVTFVAGAFVFERPAIFEGNIAAAYKQQVHLLQL